MKAILGAVAALVALVDASGAQALVGCQGQVTVIQVRADGTFEAMWGWGWRNICNLTADTASPTAIVKKDACTAIYSQFVTAKSTGQTIMSYHSNSTTCAQALTAGSGEWPAEQPYGYVIQ